MINKLKEFFLINLGLLMVAIGIYLFKIPNNFATGGVSGLAIIINNFLPGLSVGLLMMIINTVLLIMGFITVGVNFGSKTVYSSYVLSGLVSLLQNIYPIPRPLTGETFLELIYAIVFTAVGSSIVFSQGASTGGTDIVAKILNKYTHINIGKTLLIADFSIAIMAGVVFGIKTGLYSVFGLTLKAFVIDLVIENLNISKQLVIISGKPDDICIFILNELKRDATVHKAKGAFTNEEKLVITTIVNRKQATRLREYVYKLDRDAFITISNTSEIIGKGFRNLGL